MRVPGSDSYFCLMITKRQTGAAPLIPRTRAGLCGTCSGKLVYDEDFASDKCRSCSRLAGPAPRSPEEVRQGILSELTTRPLRLFLRRNFGPSTLQWTTWRKSWE